MTLPHELQQVWTMSETANFEVIVADRHLTNFVALVEFLKHDRLTWTQFTLVYHEHTQTSSASIEVLSHVGPVATFTADQVLRYGGALATASASGLLLWTVGRLVPATASSPARVLLRLSEPNLLYPANSQPTNMVLLPSGKRLKLQRHGFNPQPLSSFVAEHHACWLYATLLNLRHDDGQRVGVCVDGVLVGELSPASSQHMLPVITYVGERHGTATVRGLVRGNSLTIELTLHCKRSAEIDDSWLASTPTFVASGTSEDIPETHTSPSAIDLVEPVPGTQAGDALLPAASWYPDPYFQHRLRYWDGSAWTAFTSD